MRGRPWSLVLALAVLAAAGFLATQAPFAFHSPDGSYHAAKLLRAREGQPFLDPISGTPSIYPAFFHWLYGALGNLLDLGSLRLYSVAGLLNFLGLYAGFLLLAHAALGSLERAAFAALALPLLFYAPSGRHVLVANPANLGIPLLLAGAGLLVRSLSGKRAALLAGSFLASLGANVVWYLALPAVALIAARLWLDGSWRRPRVVAAVLGMALLPCAFTAWQFFSIREGLPAYRDWSPGGSLGPEILTGWSKVLFDKGNSRFEAVMKRSPLAWAHYYLGVLPFSAFVLALAVKRVAGGKHAAVSDAARLLLASGGLTFLLSLGLAITGDFPRVVSVQFTGWALLAVVALAWLLDRPGAAAHAARLAVVALGLTGLAATVRHGDRPFEAEPEKPTLAVIAFIRGLPGHAQERIWVSEHRLRELAPFVTFLSFVNHFEGRYYSQDPESATRLLAAHRAIADRADGWREAVDQNQVRYLAFRHSDPRDREVGLFYLGHGRARLQNSEWWVVEIGPRF